jgi:hypothetical protein
MPNYPEVVAAATVEGVAWEAMKRMIARIRQSVQME